MSQFQVKNRKGYTLVNKQKIYLSAHSKDYRYIEIITDDILKQVDCVVTYIEPHTQLEHIDDLNDMSILVFVVSQKFLCENNYARDFELKYALENNIPVLPILIEEIEYQLYIQFFMNAQYIVRESLDTTERLYEHKLKETIIEYIGSASLKEKIKHECTSQIFISYRKKDRQYANKLMENIHSIPELRDTIFWYDEYIITGKDFEKEIQNELNEADFMILLVTQNILENKNYILETEYPYAKNKNKKIIPIEMKSTDHELVHKHYPKLDHIIDGNNLQYLKDVLLPVQKKKNRNNPSHLYLMGLANYYGIYMLRNQKKGIELLEQSAQKNNYKACMKLVKYYRNGLQNQKTSHFTTQETINEVENILRQSEELKDNGAHGIFIHKNDFIKAAFYQEKIIKIIYDRYKKNKTFENALVICLQLLNLHYIYINYDEEKNRKVLLQMEKEIICFHKKYPAYKDYFSHELKRVYSKLEESYEYYGEMDLANYYQQKSASIKVVENIDEKVHRLMGLQQYQECIDILESYLDTNDQINTRVLLMNCYILLCKQKEENQEIEDVVKYAKIGKEYARQLVNESPNVYKMDLIIFDTFIEKYDSSKKKQYLLRQEADDLIKKGNKLIGEEYKKAIQCYENAKNIYKTLVEEYDEYNDYLSLADCYRCLHILKCYPNTIQFHFDDIDQCIQVCEKIYLKYESKKNIINYIIALVSKALYLTYFLEKTTFLFSGKRKLYQKELEELINQINNLMDKNKREINRQEYNRLLMFAYMLEGICYNDMDKINKACVLFKKTNQSDSLLCEILQSYQRKNTTDILHSFKVFFRYQPEGLLITKY